MKNKYASLEFQGGPEYEEGEEERWLLSSPLRRWKPPLSPRSSLTLMVAAALFFLLLFIAGNVLGHSKSSTPNGKRLSRKQQREGVMSLTSPSSPLKSAPERETPREDGGQGEEEEVVVVVEEVKLEGQEDDAGVYLVVEEASFDVEDGTTKAGDSIESEKEAYEEGEGLIRLRARRR